MKIETMITLFAAMFALNVCGANVWTNLTPENRIGGRMVSAGYLKGKVVMIDCRDYAAKTRDNVEAMQYFQTVWTSYKTKPFVLIGSHCGGSQKVAAAISGRAGVTYPIYIEAKVNGEVPGFVYVYDSTLQKLLYKGKDPREAVGVVGSAIMAATTPMTQAQFEFLLDWEVENLPGQAYNRFKEYKKKFPKESKKYDEQIKTLLKNSEVAKLAKLVSLAESVKDRDPNAKNAKKLTAASLEGAIKNYEPLKESSDENIVQEAKNALAELKWVAATLK